MIKKDIPSSFHSISTTEVDALLLKNDIFMNITTKIIQKMETNLISSNLSIILSNKDNYILCMYGNKSILNELTKKNIILGSVLDDKFINNTDSLCFDKFPLNWMSKKFYNKSNEFKGRVTIYGKYSKDIKNIIDALLTATSNAIENRLESFQINKRLSESNQFAFAMMNNLSNGVLAIDLNDNIEWINDTACRSLNIKRSFLIKKQISSILPGWEKVRRIILNGLVFLDEEMEFKIKDSHDRYLFNSYTILTPEHEIIGYILSFRLVSRVFKIIKKLKGINAKYIFDDIIGISSKIKETIAYAKSISINNSTVLITGESGTGKEMFAQSIHNYSERSNGPFVALNCGAISNSLIESELFGYEEGAFTGANRGGKIGKFETANGGTIFLDEIGEMSLEVQVKVLRAIQEKSINRVGSSKSIDLDVRIIAATHRDLEDEVEKKNFRLDLFYRLNVIPLNIPSLRDRKKDIRPLLNQFLKLKASKLNKPIPKISTILYENILEYNWPGNVRELDNFSERLLIIGESVLFNMSRSKEEKSNHVEIKEANNNFTPITLENIEKETIKSTLEFNEGNISKSAQMLHIGRNTLYQKIKKYNLNIL